MGIRIKENVSLANLTTFRIGGLAKYFVEAKSKEDLKEAIFWAKEKSLSYFILGGGSNLLASDEGFNGLIIKNLFSDYKEEKAGEDLILKVSAGVSFAKVILDTSKNNFTGVEWGFGIPGTIGGAIFGNAGRLGQDISQVVSSVKVWDKNLDEKILPFKECEFNYRESRFKKTEEIIIEAELKFKKGESQKINETLGQARDVVTNSPKFPSAGCIFKNYKLKGEGDSLLINYPELAQRVRGGKIGVGYFIDQCGLKGRQSGGAKIWEGHANYIINIGDAKAKDVLGLINLCKKSVKEKFNLNLEEEIRYLGLVKQS